MKKKIVLALGGNALGEGLAEQMQAGEIDGESDCGFDCPWSSSGGDARQWPTGGNDQSGF